MGKNILQILHKILRSRKFIYVIVGLLFVQAAWFALTAQYPMAFDENYHFGLIHIYSQQWLPFINGHPPNSEAFGEIVRYDSYMFHYLMSFPYRLIAAFTGNQYIQIVLLRFIDIGMFIGGMFLFRNLLRRIHLSDTLIHFIFLIFILIPVVPFLAATISYDNLLFLIVPLFIGLTIQNSDTIKHNKLQAAPFLSMLFVGIIGCLVKYAFVPIFLASILYVFVLWLRSPQKQKIITSVWQTFLKERRYLQIVLIVMSVLSLGLFIERYGVNIVQYHRYEPTCEQVRSIDECIQFGPWGRDYKTKQAIAESNPPYDPAMPLFLPAWVNNYMYRLYFAVNYDYASANPLPLPYYTAYIIGIFGLLLCLVFWRSIVKIDRYLLLFALIIVFYVGALFYTNFTGYLKLHTIVAANGRYLIVIMPLIFAWIGVAYRQLFVKFLKSRSRNALVILAFVSVCLTLNGGGAETHLLRSQPWWYWQDGPASEVNMTMQRIISPFILGSGAVNTINQQSSADE